MKKTQILIITSAFTLLLGLFGGYLLGITNSANNFGMHRGMMQHTDHSSAQSHGGGMGMGMGSMMLNTQGDTNSYEQAWLARMMMHHQGAVVMSQKLLNRSERPELRGFAENIITTQSEEIDTMQNWLDAWYENE